MVRSGVIPRSVGWTLLKKMMHPMGRGRDYKKDKNGGNGEPAFTWTLKGQFTIQSRHDRRRPNSLAHKPMTIQRHSAVVILRR